MKHWLKKFKTPTPVEFAFEAMTELQFAAAEEGESPSLPIFAIKAYNGGELRMPQFRHPVVVDLQGMEITEKNRPALLDHDTKQRVGHTTKIINAGTHLEIMGVVSATGKAAQEVVASAKNDFPWQASIGVSLKKPLELVEAGRTVTVNGRSVVGPVFVARETLLREISFTALGVDDSTESKIAASQGEETMGFDEWLEERGFIAASLTDSQLTFLKGLYEQGGEPAPAADVKASLDAGALLAEFRTSLAAEAERVRKINEICASVTESVEIDGQQVDLAAHAIAAGWTTEQVELRALRAQLSRRSPSAVLHREAADVARDAQALEAALVLKYTDQNEEFAAQHYSQEVLNRATSREIRAAASRPLSYMMHEAIRSRGGYVAPATHGDNLLKAYEEQVLQAAGPSTFSLPGILSNVANKSAIASFLAIPTTWRSIAGVRPVNDFKIYTVYQLTAEGQFEKVGKDGEIKTGELQETSWTNRVETYGKRYHFTRQDIINDDLSMLDGIRALLGRQAALTLEDAVYRVWMDETDGFWSPADGNLVTGTALSPAGLAQVEQIFLDMTDDAGKPIVQGPSGILVPTSLKYTADRIYSSTMFNETTAVGSPELSQNIMNGRFAPIVTPYLNNPAMPFANPSDWFMLSSQLKALQVAFLNGTQTPTIESERAEFHVLGFQFRGYFDFGVARWSNRGAIKVEA